MELLARGDLRRCLIVCPGVLGEQWQDELYDKFQLPFEILTTDKLESARTGNRIALYSIDQACRVLGWAVASVIALVCPRRVVIGGGVSMVGEQLFPRSSPPRSGPALLCPFRRKL